MTAELSIGEVLVLVPAMLRAGVLVNHQAVYADAWRHDKLPATKPSAAWCFELKSVCGTCEAYLTPSCVRR